MDIFMRFPLGKAKAFTLSYDDGQRQDKRLVEIFNKNGLKCTFNVNSGLYNAPVADNPFKGRMSLDEMIPVYEGHEVAVHTVTHPFLEKLPLSLVSSEVLDDRRNIEKTWGRIVRGMAYPYGTFNDVVVDCLKSCGIAYSRTVKSTEKFGIPTDWLRLDPTCHHANSNVFSIADRFLSKHSGRAPWLFYLWGHSFEFDRGVDNNNWEHAEKLFAYIGGHDDVWYATNIEIYNYVQAYNSLVFSTDAKIVHNPTSTKVFLCVGGNTMSVNPGETVEI